MKITQNNTGVQIDLSDSDYTFEYDAELELLTISNRQSSTDALIQQLKTSSIAPQSEYKLSDFLRRNNRNVE